MAKNAKTVGLRSVAKPPLGPMQKIVESARQGKLVVVVGTGVSIGLTNGLVPSWTGLIKNGFEYGNKKGRVTNVHLDTWSNQLASTDMDDLLGAAEFMGRKLGAPADQVYGRWLEEVFSSVQPQNERLSSALKILASLGIPICTLNYDHLLEDVTGLPALLVSDTQKVISWMRREYPAILHLHGSWDTPSSCILGIRDYETTQTNEVRDLFQRNLAAFNHLLFIGCGDTLADPNFSALVEWLRTKLQARTPQHIALTREDDVSRRNVDPAWLGFVEPLSFGKAHDDLAEFLHQHFTPIAPKKSPRKSVSVSSESNTILEDYRLFLLRDCGQMTIEGVSADMDTGQRKFDLERLFVPLNVSACPPEFSASDPDSAAKLEQWKKENRGAVPFGKILASHKRLALLALPGGGKTLLLKRLAVAYADSSRRTA
ncbi:MAG: SIR2 family protein, partial [Rhodocyclaceae bacterium]